jgi:hypothetical protein
MNEMEKYKCKVCGKQHPVFRVLESPLPDLIEDIPEKERELRVEKLDCLFMVDKKSLLGSGYIYIHMKGLEEPIFYWQVWTTIEPADFKKNLKKMMDGETVELRGRLESEIPFYSVSRGLESKMLIGGTNEIQLEVRIAEDSQLKEDQSKPITKERVIEMMQYIHHAELFVTEKKFDAPFYERLREELVFVEEKYIQKNKNFAINISSQSSVLFQIINTSLLESGTVNSQGFGLHLSFDVTFEELKDRLEKFKTMAYEAEFEYHYLDGIPTYQIDLGNDKEGLEELVIKLLVDIYEQEIEKIEVESFEL